MGIKIPSDHQQHHQHQQLQHQEQQSILQSLLANKLLSVANHCCPVDACPGPGANPCPQRHVPGCSKVHKRKPLVVRRLLPGHPLPLTSYCSNPHPFAAGGSAAPQDQPLDLRNEKAKKRGESECEDPVQNLIRTVEQSAAEAASIIASVRRITPHPHHDPAQRQDRSLRTGANQRSVIKQKLEDAFRENGFLVKTKQVSDGEATFCKFRQLRKYTRYYLKSWHKHLPDDVNQLYKGFLPPVSDKGKKQQSEEHQVTH